MGSVIPVLVAGMLISGAANSLVTKYQDNQEVGIGLKYEQPVLQTLNMFIGETLCLIVFYFLKSRFNPFRTGQSELIEQAKLSAEQATTGDLRNDGNYDSVGIESEIKMKTATGWKKVALFWLPATFDIIGTSLMNVGLFYVRIRSNSKEKLGN